NDEVDAVSIAVPNFMHAPVAIAALDAGKHVLIEKPLARNEEEGRQMVEAAERNGKILAISYQRRTRHDVQIVREQVQSGAFGRVYYSKAFWMRRSGIPGWGSWFTSKEAAGGGPLIDLGVHVLDLALYVLGNPRVTSVSASTYAEIGTQGRGNWVGASNRFVPEGHKGYEVEDLASAFIRFEDGGTLLLEASWASYGEMEDDFGIQVYGSQGGARIHSVKYSTSDTLRIFSGIADTTQVSAPVVVAREGHAGITRGFVDGILNGTPVSPDGYEGLDRVRLIDAIYRSAELVREVLLEDVPVSTAVAE
ncbi:MAG TPA: Gfo/Idh/MocA family oxidoreductase, partial [Thermomicrobiales bacterium]|nr:Gfo/Idh/MocA family oxidoreductase [Thermomicrobiales bacterium]